MFNDFASSLRSYAQDAAKRQALLASKESELGGSVYLAPANVHPVYWRMELERRYSNMAEFEGWEALPDYTPFHKLPVDLQEAFYGGFFRDR